MPATTQTAIEQTPDDLRLVMQVPRLDYVVVFLGVWLACWAFGEIVVLRTLFEFGSMFDPGVPFMVVWLAGWTCGGAGAVFILAMLLDGSEIVTFSPERIVRRVNVFGWGWESAFAMDSVTDLRQTPGSNGAGIFISFDTSGKTIRFGTGLDEATAEEITNTIWARFPRLVPCGERIRGAEVGASRQTGPDTDTSVGISWA
jgi:hypothetical protein